MRVLKAHILRRVLMDVTGGGENSFADLVAKWMAKFLNEVMTPSTSGGIPGVVYSDFARAFVRVPSLIKGAQQWNKTILAENWLDRSELASLCTILGSRGFKIVDEQILGICTGHAKKLRSILTKEAKSLSVFGDLVSKCDPN